jgi:hypothetical protein
VLQASRAVVSPARGDTSATNRAAVAYFARSGRTWEVDTGGSLFVAAPGGVFHRVGTVPSPDSRTGAGYEPDFTLSGDPTDPATLYVNSDALYTSRDGGRTWHGTGHNAGGFWNGLVVADGSVVYALRAPNYHPCGSCDQGPYPWRLFSSSDKGMTWQKVAEYQANEVWGLVPAPNQPPGSIFVETSSGLFLHTPRHGDIEQDSGIQRSYGSQPSTVLLAASGRSHPVLYLARSSGDNAIPIQLYASDDQGRHWHLRRSPFHQRQGALLDDPARSDVAYAVVNTKLVRGSFHSIVWGYESKIFATDDSANSWREIWHGCLRGSTINPTPAELIPGKPDTIIVQLCDGRIRIVRA